MPAAYLKLGDLKGESSDARFKGWIPVESYSIDQIRGVGGGGGGSQQSFSKAGDMSVTKLHDRTSPDLMNAASKGLHFDHAILCRMGMPEGMVGSAFLMDSIIISGISFQSDTGAMRPMESLSLNFRTMTMGSTADYSAPYGPAAPANRRKVTPPAGRPTAAAGAKRP